MRYRFGEHTLDTDTLQLLAGDVEIDLEPQVFAVLVHLVEHRERVVSKEELLDTVWGSRFVSESALTTRIKQVRQAIGDTGREQALVRTFHGRGYRFVADVTDVVAAVDPGRALPTDAGRPRPATDPSSHSRPVTRYADSSGASIAYQTFGVGPDLVLIAGFATNVEAQWEHPRIAAFLRRLGAFARVTVLDKRGVGLSDRVPHDSVPPLETRADDLVAVLDAAGIERANLLGSSEGGSLAAVFTASHPELVERLILHNTWVTGPTFPRAGASDLDYVLEHWGTGRVYRYLGPGLAAEPGGRELLARLERQSATPRTARHLLELIGRVDIAGVLGAISVPTLVLHREDDPVVSTDHSRRLATSIPGSRLVLLDGADHYLFSGESGQTLDWIERFVTDSPPAEPAAEHVLATVLVVIGAGAVVDRPVATRVIERQRGQVVAAGDDVVMATFDGPGRAVRAGVEVCDAAVASGATVRVGVHAAEIERRGEAVCGLGVEIARRVASLASPGEVWVSRTVPDLVAGTGLVFHERGVHPVAGDDRSWHLSAAALS